MTNSITNKQMVMILIITLTCYSVVTISKEMAQTAGRGGWLSLLITAIIFALASVVIVSLNNKFPGKMLFEYSPAIISKPVTYMLCVYYILYFFIILVFLITMKAKLLKADFFTDTPLWAFPMIGIPVFCSVAYKGINNVARLSEIVGTIFIITAVIVHILMATEGRVNRVLPFFNSMDIGNYLSGIKTAIFPFLGIEVLLAIPLAKKSIRKSKKTAFFAVLFIGLFYILVVESCIMKIGINDIVVYDDALIVAIRDTAPEGIDLLARLDILYLTIGFGAIFIGISIVMTVIVEYICRIFPRLRRLSVVIAVGIVSYIAFFIVKEIPDYDKFVEETGTFLGLAAAIFIPSILLVIAKIRKLGVKIKKNAS